MQPTLQLARALIDAQFPEYASLQLVPLPSPGTDNAIFRLGADRTVRMPRVEWAKFGAAREIAILPNMTGLGLDIPEPIALGEASRDFPAPWSILKWVEGEPATSHTFSTEDARALAGFIAEMQTKAPDAAWAAGEANHFRGVPLVQRTAPFKAAVDALADLYDPATLFRIWEAALSAEEECVAVWLHGDLHGGNLIVRDGQLCGVIDWGLAGVGDGACDLAAAWALFDGDARIAFREALSPSQAAWTRGAGWALSIAAIFLAYYRNKNVPVDGSERTIARLLEAFP
ncbi:MAG: aminoglycoside phosphotransferase family protein [Pseudomonadota bacterium]